MVGLLAGNLDYQDFKRLTREHEADFDAWLKRPKPAFQVVWRYEEKRHRFAKQLRIRMEVTLREEELELIVYRIGAFVLRSEKGKIQ